MGRFFSRNDVSDLESQLRDGRPEPPAELLDQLVTRVGPIPTSRPVGQPRLAAALVFAVVVLVALAAFGGVGYATSSISSAAKNSRHAVTSVVKQGENKKQNNKSDEKNNKSENKNKGGNHHDDDDDEHEHHDPPWEHQYVHWVVICWRNHTIIVPRAWLPHFAGYTPARCARR
jgi:hypothetical protein